MIDQIFYEIPIYRCERDSHTEDMKKQRSLLLKNVSKELHPDSYKWISNHFDSSVWYPWKYNEVVGYLNLYILGSQLRADVWQIDKKRINKGIIKKRFKCFGKTLEKGLPRDKSSEELFSFILDQLMYLNKTEYKKFTFDLESFKNVGAFVNWKQLIEKLRAY